MVKGVAERRGWAHKGHSERSASNFYDNWNPREMIEQALEQVEEFIQKLEALP